MGLTFVNEQVLPELRAIRRGRRVIVPVAELTRWLEAEGEAIAETVGAQRSP